MRPRGTAAARRRLTAYAGAARAQIRTQLAHRGDFLLRVVGLLVQIYLLRLVWEAVYPASGTATAGGGQRVPLDTQLAYTTFAAVQNWLLGSTSLAMSTLFGRVRDGSVALDLARPVAYPMQMLFTQAGAVLAAVPFAVLALPFAVLVGGAQPPASAGAALVCAAALVPACLSALLLAVIVGMVSFWTTEVTGIFMIYDHTARFFAGALVPLWFMPGWLAALAWVLPFQTTTYTPVALYLGRIGGTGEVARALVVQYAWAVALWLLMRLVWSRALRRVVVQGG